MDRYSEHRHNEQTARLWHADAVECLSQLGDGSVDLIITSPPYFIGKEYDKSSSLEDFIAEIARVLPSMLGALSSCGSVCWQVGNHVASGRLTPLDLIIAEQMRRYPDFVLRNRIIWSYGHGAHDTRRFSGRHETIMWYTLGDNYYFDLDAVRIPQSYPGKRHYKGPKKGAWSGNPLGKNPSDVWEIGQIWPIPNVKSNHIEKTTHPCQFPSALARRLVAALTPKAGIVADPYVGSGTAAVAALLEGRSFVGGDIEAKYLEVAKTRIEALESGGLRVRPDTPIKLPNASESVAKAPSHFRAILDGPDG